MDCTNICRLQYLSGGLVKYEISLYALVHGSKHGLIISHQLRYDLVGLSWILKTLVTAIGAGLGAWGVINLMEGYGNDNPGAKSQGIKQFMAK